MSCRFFGLEVHGAPTGGNAAAQRLAHELFAGSVAIYFFGGTLLLGLLVPAALACMGLRGPLSLAAMVVLLALASAFGGFVMKYSTIRAGAFLPVCITSIASASTDVPAGGESPPSRTNRVQHSISRT